MSTRFFADKQTLNDLNIPGRHKNNSISRLFDVAVTTGGQKLLDSMFQNPLTDSVEINRRSSIFQYFAGQVVAFPFTGEEFEIMENYLSSGNGGHLLSAGISILSKKVLQLVAQDPEYMQLNAEVAKTIELLNQFYDFVNRLQVEGSPYEDQARLVKNTFSHPKLSWLKEAQGLTVLPLFRLIRIDQQLRTRMHEQLKALTRLIFELDVYISVAAIGRQKGFTYARALPKGSNILTVENLYHPAVENAVGNTLSLNEDRNVIFLTGANMAGKSTLMKSFGTCMYLAHMGFPVAASQMVFSVKDGLYTSINVPDNLDMGYSHFYAEVLRVKTVAEEVAAGKDLLVIFDELFKGTNVKDAYDATLAITEAFSENRTCFFMISTHIIEVGEALRTHCANFRFAYLPTEMDGPVPRYTYQLKDGITADRQGMIIIENEGILALLKEF